MVYKDISDANSAGPFKSKASNQTVSAPPFFKAAMIDRFFSFLIDYLIFSPVVSFFLLTLFQVEVTVWRSSITRSENLPIVLLLATAYVALFSLLQSFFIYFWKATPGQHFLKLQIKIETEPGLIFFRIWLRQIGFWISALFLGLPWLAILSHPKQKTFYDRLSETAVVSLKSEQRFFSFEIEKKYFRSLQATITVFLILLTVGYAWSQHKKIKLAGYTFTDLKKKDAFCSELKTVKLESRLQTAIALNLIDQLSDSCLNKEAEFTLWSMQDESLLSLAYYAKSLTQTEKVEENNYLRQACSFKKADYFGCQVASAFLEEDLHHLYKALVEKTAPKNLLTAILRYELGVKYEKTVDQTANFHALKKYDKSHLVRKYLIGEVLDNQLQTLKPVGDRVPASTEGRRYKNKISLEDLQYAQDLINDMD